MRRHHGGPLAPHQRPHPRQALVGQPGLEGEVASRRVDVDERRLEQEAVAPPQPGPVVRHRRPDAARAALEPRPGDDDAIARLRARHGLEAGQRRDPRPHRERAGRLVERHQLALPAVGCPALRPRPARLRPAVGIDRQQCRLRMRRSMHGPGGDPGAARQGAHRAQAVGRQRDLEHEIAVARIHRDESRAQEKAGGVLGRRLGLGLLRRRPIRTVVAHHGPNPARLAPGARPGDDDRFAGLHPGCRFQPGGRNYGRLDRHGTGDLVERHQLAVPAVGLLRRRRRRRRGHGRGAERAHEDGGPTPDRASRVGPPRSSSCLVQHHTTPCRHRRNRVVAAWRVAKPSGIRPASSPRGDGRPTVCPAGPAADPPAINAPLATGLSDARRLKTGLGVAVYVEGRAFDRPPAPGIIDSRAAGVKGNSRVPGKKLAA